ncbi:hypothetical protein APHAL10511_004722 [Amanita phalloides]|nr:hypothetical protein APHAL10511_004722 [Amanita phalloides]
MPLNIPGIFAPFHALVRPRLVIPSLAVKDIRQIDFAALHKHGYRGVVFDKDNCLTLPHHDTIVPAIEDAWYECREAFGQGNVIIVSNTAGTWVDPGGIQSESVSYHLGVPVLQHKRFKPSYSCISDIRSYFSSLRSPVRDEELVVVGDRIFTDIVTANRMRYWKPKPNGSIFGIAASCAFEKGGAIETEKEVASEIAKLTKGPRGPLSIWTTGVWEKEALLMRCAEKLIVKAVQRQLKQDGFGDTSKFLKPIPALPKKPNIIDRFLDKVYIV